MSIEVRRPEHFATSKWCSSNNYWGLSVSQNTGRDLVIPYVSSNSYDRESLVVAVSDAFRELGPFCSGHCLCDLHQFSLKDLGFDRITSRESLIIFV